MHNFKKVWSFSHGYGFGTGPMGFLKSINYHKALEILSPKLSAPRLRLASITLQDSQQTSRHA